MQRSLEVGRLDFLTLIHDTMALHTLRSPCDILSYLCIWIPYLGKISQGTVGSDRSSCTCKWTIGWLHKSTLSNTKSMVKVAALLIGR